MVVIFQNYNNTKLQNISSIQLTFFKKTQKLTYLKSNIKMMNNSNQGNLQLIQKMFDDQKLSSPYSGGEHQQYQYKNISSKKLFQFQNKNQQNFIQQQTAQLTIQLDSQKKATIIIHKQDDPLTLAKKFCYQYHVDTKIINALTKNIRDVKLSLNDQIGYENDKENNCYQGNILKNSNLNNKNNGFVSSPIRKCHQKNQNKIKNDNIKSQSKKSDDNFQNLNKKSNQNNYFEQLQQIYNNTILSHKLIQNSQISYSTSKYNTNRFHNTSFQSIHHLHATSQPKIKTLNTDQRNQKINNSMMSQKGLKKNICNIIEYPNPKIQLNNYYDQYQHQNQKQKQNHTYYHQSAKNSRSSIKNHQNSNVFDRLYNHHHQNQYNDSKSKQTQTIKPAQTIKKEIKQKGSITKSLNNSQCSNFLYDRNIKIQQQTKRKNKILLQNQINKQLQQCTHQPKINQISKIVAQKLKCDHNYSNNALTSHQKKRNSRIISYLKDRQQKQLQECTFQPKLISKNKYQNFMTIEERCQLLHQDHNMRLIKQKQINQQIVTTQHSFKPKINDISKEIVKDRKFFDRLKEDEHHRKEKQALIQNTKKNQKKRKPSTGRAPLARNKGNMNAGQYLYERHKSKILENKSKSQSQQKIKHTIPKSQLIYEQRKKMAMRFLFVLMDNDQDGYISPTKINTNGLNQDVLKLISPLLSQMEEIKEELNETEFIQSFNRLFETFSIHQKNCILNIYKHSQSDSHLNQQQLKFHPQINLKSQQIVKKKQIRPRGMSLYDIWKQNQYQREEKLEKIRAMKIHEEYEKCTFHPQLISKKTFF